MAKLRAAVIGLAEGNETLIEQVRQGPAFEVVAVANEDRDRLRARAEEYGVEGYEDHRSLIVQEAFDVLFLLQPTHQCGDCFKWLAKKPVHVFKQAPLARTLPEAHEWVRQLARQERHFHVGTPKRFARGYAEAHRLVGEGRIGRVYLARAECFQRFAGPLDWRGDPVLAGGGALLEFGYHLVDQILWTMGPPERIYGQRSDFCSKQSLPPHLTEDTATVQMGFPNGAAAVLSCGWMSAPATEKITYHGETGQIVATPRSLDLTDSAGQCLDRQQWPVEEKQLCVEQLRCFAAYLTDDEIEPSSTAGEHLANVAAIEAAYLSCRTRMPEDLKVYGSIIPVEQ